MLCMILDVAAIRSKQLLMNHRVIAWRKRMTWKKINMGGWKRCKITPRATKSNGNFVNFSTNKDVVDCLCLRVFAKFIQLR